MLPGDVCDTEVEAGFAGVPWVSQRYEWTHLTIPGILIRPLLAIFCMITHKKPKSRRKLRNCVFDVLMPTFPPWGGEALKAFHCYLDWFHRRCAVTINSCICCSKLAEWERPSRYCKRLRFWWPESEEPRAIEVVATPWSGFLIRTRQQQQIDWWLLTIEGDALSIDIRIHEPKQQTGARISNLKSAGSYPQSQSVQGPPNYSLF